MSDYGKAGYDLMRPAMQQDWHPDHNMPAPEHDGTMLNVNTASKGDMEKKQDRYGDNSADLPNYREDNEWRYGNERK